MFQVVDTDVRMEQVRSVVWNPVTYYQVCSNCFVSGEFIINPAIKVAFH